MTTEYALIAVVTLAAAIICGLLSVLGKYRDENETLRGKLWRAGDTINRLRFKQDERRRKLSEAGRKGANVTNAKRRGQECQK